MSHHNTAVLVAFTNPSHCPWVLPTLWCITATDSLHLLYYDVSNPGNTVLLVPKILPPKSAAAAEKHHTAQHQASPLESVTSEVIFWWP